MADQKLQAETRTTFGKGSARQARRAGQIPAVIYGHGAEPIHILLPARETTLAVRHANALLTLVDNKGENHLALVKDVQRDPVKQIIEHIDLLTVRSGEKVIVDVPIHVEGELAPGAIMIQEEVAVSVEADATHLPESLTISIEGRTAGQHVLASDIELPANVTLLADPELVIINVTAPAAAAAEGEAAAEAPAAAEAE
jgi:large subunit ribosomal protein L25